MRRHVFWFTLLALSSAFVAATVSAQTASTKKPATSEEKLPPSLSHEIRHQLLVLPFYSVFDSINFSLEGRKVTLTGQVLRRSLKEHAEAAVKSLEGVTAVINQIEVLPPSPSDDELRDAVYRALYEDPTLERYAIQNIPPLHIIVKNGAVALEGSVDSLSDKNLAGARVGRVPNVVVMKNNLVVRPQGSAAE
jgi:hyperosmotically inducible periplasmic protein